MDKIRFDRTQVLPAVAASVLLIAGALGLWRVAGPDRQPDSDEVSSRDVGSEDRVSTSTTGPPSTEKAEQTTTSTNDTERQNDVRQGLKAGTYCYVLQSDVGATGSITLDVAPDTSIRVRQSVDAGGRRDPANVSSFEGSATLLDDERLSVDGEQWVEGATEPTSIENDIWAFSDNVITIGEQTSTFVASAPSYITTDCANIDRPTPPPTPDPVEGLTIRVNEEIKFAPGATSGSKSGAVIRGERDVYRVEVGPGQTMSVSITSLEDNAVFDLITPSGSVRNGEATAIPNIETTAGVYQIVIGGTRGNATYELTVSVT